MLHDRKYNTNSRYSYSWKCFNCNVLFFETSWRRYKLHIIKKYQNYQITNQSIGCNLVTSENPNITKDTLKNFILWTFQHIHPLLHTLHARTHNKNNLKYMLNDRLTQTISCISLIYYHVQNWDKWTELTCRGEKRNCLHGLKTSVLNIMQVDLKMPDQACDATFWALKI